MEPPYVGALGRALAFPEEPPLRAVIESAPSRRQPGPAPTPRSGRPHEPPLRRFGRGGRILALDGIRAIAIALVLLAHGLGAATLASRRLAHIAADLGVRTFFVLSGYLITSLLMAERESTGSISLPRFYARRCLRLAPALYAYIALTAVLAAVGIVQLKDHDLLCAATYSMNFHAERAWGFGHLWSIAVEEQFYLLWPVALVCFGGRWARSIAVLALVVAPFVRIAAWYVLPGWRALSDQAFPCVFDALAAGCAVALFQAELAAWLSRRRSRTARLLWILPVGCAVVLVPSTPWLELGPATCLANVAIAMLVLLCVRGGEVPGVAVLEHPGFRQLGTLSYSLYLWQQLFLDRHATGWLHAFPENLALAVLAAAVSYYVIESPFLRISARLRPRSRAAYGAQ